MRFSRLSAKVRRNGKSYQMSLKQLMMSGLIRADEIAAKYYWWYKAEVPFDIAHAAPPLSQQHADRAGQAAYHQPFSRTGKRHLSLSGRDYSEEQEGPLAGTCGARYRGSDACG
jgi:hypothetical protein